MVDTNERIAELAKVLLLHGAAKTNEEAMDRARAIVSGEHANVNQDSEIEQLNRDLQNIKEEEIKDELNAADLDKEIEAIDAEIKSETEQAENMTKQVDKTEKEIEKSFEAVEEAEPENK